MNELIAGATAANALFMLLSVGAAIATYRANRTMARAQSLIQVAEWFRRDEVKLARQEIYQLRRDEHENWTEENRKHIATWVGYLDVVSTLILTKDLKRKDFVRMYGDTVFRTLFVLAPWLGTQYSTFGSQYLKSTQMAMPKLIREWDKLSRTGIVTRLRGGNYPRQIKIAWTRPEVIDPDSFRNDNGIRAFLKD